MSFEDEESKGIRDTRMPIWLRGIRNGTEKTIYAV
ncbi:MAG: hypothetical protein BMS9Abin06_1021 [Gammaproteobacteria bacterium]|nr:MAG: hypothetical protein BMS9Abin06_1021 [Gammaproteobacteria bacterium]